IQTLTDKEYQVLRDASLAIMRKVGVETGGSNVQFAVNPNPDDGQFQFVVIEMNPRVSRSSALASKATGFPIAKIAAKLAIGYTLDELRNDITGTTSACFEPSIDYVVTKMPRWTFEKFPEADETLTTQMKSVGEAMAIGRTFKESFQKVIRSMDVKRFGFGLDRNDKWLAAMRAVEHGQLVLDFAPETSSAPTPGGTKPQPEDASPTGLRTADGAPIEWPVDPVKLARKLSVPSQGRLYYVRYALKMGWSIERIHELSRIDPWYLDQFLQLVRFEDELCGYASLEELPRDVLHKAKSLGYSDAQLANLYLREITSESILQVRAHRKAQAVECVYKLVDTCAAEFEAVTPYYYSTYEQGRRVVNADGSVTELPPEDEIRVTETPKVVILGGGPNRIGQGIEFDYCCVHAAYAARDLGFESVMINSNPETVSTDYDTSDLLFFEPLTLEDVLNVTERLNGAGHVLGCIVQFGGQTPLNLAHGLAEAGAPLLGTSLDSIDLAEDRDRFDALLERLELSRPASGIARSLDQAVEIAERIGYPVLVRPSYVLGGRGMEICPDSAALRHYMTNALDVSGLDDAPILIDQFLDGATEIDVDVVADFDPAMEGAQPNATAMVCGVMEHIEQAGVHSGDSACTIPPNSLTPKMVERIKIVARKLAAGLRVCGLMNLQLALKDDEIYIIEVNPRASRTVPFVAKATHTPWPAVAAKAMMGRALSALKEELGVDEPASIRDPSLRPGAYAVKEVVFPFEKFPGVDVVLGPEMRSTGEVMGIDASFPGAYLKGLLAAGMDLPKSGGVFISVRHADKEAIADPARSLIAMGFEVYSTGGTAEVLRRHGLRTTVLEKIGAGARPNVLDLMTDGAIQLVINTPTRTGWRTDEGRIRATAVRLGIPMITTVTGAIAGVRAIEALRAGDWQVAALQDHAAAAGLTISVPGAAATPAGT
ncbi:MAG: carbamoyl-phosphate synthase large subunit, partial [Planctomycetota bacterium]